MSPPALIYNLCNKRKKGYMYGFKPHSNIIPNGRAEIHLPGTARGNTLYVKLLDYDGKVLFVDGARCDQSFHELRPLGNGSYDVKLEIKDTSGHYTDGKIVMSVRGDNEQV